MAFHSLSDFFSMGGHGVYVWTAYGITLTLLLLYIVGLMRQQTRIKHHIKRMAERDAAATASQSFEVDQ